MHTVSTIKNIPVHGGTGNVESIPAGKEMDMREFVHNVLYLMKEKTPADAAVTASAG